MSDKEKEKWEKVFIPQMVSSEESDESDEETIVIKPLQWRAERVDSMFHALDSQVAHNKTSQAKRQRKNRVISSVYSTRAPPSVPKWAIA